MFIAHELTSARAAILRRHPARGLRRVAFSALWQPLISFELLSSISRADVEALFDAEDPFSLLCGFELCRARVAVDAEFAALGDRFLQKFLVDESVPRIAATSLLHVP